MTSMTKRTILITGAGSGLGRGLGLFLAAQGHVILATDLDGETARETAAQIQAAGGNAEAYALDVGSEAGVKEFFDAIGRDRVEVLVNNAGLQRVAPLEEFTAANWDMLMQVMLRGVFLMSRAVLPGMRARGFGRLVHIGSIHSIVASPYKSAYVTAKHGLIGFSKVIALETADAEITSNVLCPGYIRTPLVDSQIKDQARARHISEDEVIQTVMLERMPKKTFITSEEVGATVEYLINPLSRNVTGQAIGIDGGWTAQ